MDSSPRSCSREKEVMLWTSRVARNFRPRHVVTPLDRELRASLITVGILAKEALRESPSSYFLRGVSGEDKAEIAHFKGAQLRYPYG
jgi:hypothetical protein